MTDSAPLPATVLTGYLGAGKTTLLNRILSEPHGLRIAVVVNEFGEVGVDDALVIGAREEVVSFANGCLCCTFKGDLLETLEKLLRKRGKLDHVIVETSGVASPGPIVQSFHATPELRATVRLDGVLTVVDAKHVEQHLEVSPEVREQIALADRLLLSKVDLVDAARVDALTAQLTAMNPLARVQPAVLGDVPVSELLALGGFDPARLDTIPAGDAAHEQGVTSVGFDEAFELDPETTTHWLRFLVSRRGQDLYRLKGVLAMRGQPKRFVVQGVHQLFEAKPDREWRDDEERRCKLVFIGRGLEEDELRRGLEACRAR
ncbi:MAG: cobalamin biosynthesis protein CobW [Planctomycetota bacterium]|nr:MAG: cobalamin biosynthesis protein CobW [Planctomycetota bacterium]